MSIIRRGVFFVVLAVFGVSLAACENTIRGAGQDIQETGDAVEDTVEGNP
jgi:predicted small secreted protein